MTISTSISFSSITISNISHLEVYRMAAPYNKKHWVLSQYALSSLSKQPNSRYWHKSSFRAFWVIQKCIFVTFEWSSMCHIVAKLFEPSCTITICIIKSIQETKLQILAQIVLLRTLDHSKMQYCDFWMIQHVPYWSQIVSTIFYSEYAISSGFNKPTSRKPLFGTLDISKMLFYDFWMVLHDLVVLPEVEKH